MIFILIIIYILGGIACLVGGVAISRSQIDKLTDPNRPNKKLLVSNYTVITTICSCLVWPIALILYLLTLDDH